MSKKIVTPNNLLAPVMGSQIGKKINTNVAVSTPVKVDLGNPIAPITDNTITAPVTMGPFTTGTGPYGSQEVINVGMTPNDGEGDPLRVAFQKINNNFTNLFFTTTNTTTTYTVGTTANQVIATIPVTSFTQGTFQIWSSDQSTIDSQGVTLNAQILPDNSDIKYTGFATTFTSNVLTRYSMDVSAGNVRVLASPLVGDILVHFISSQVTYIGTPTPGANVQLDGYVDSDMATENLDFTISTEQ